MALKLSSDDLLLSALELNIGEIGLEHLNHYARAAAEKSDEVTISHRGKSALIKPSLPVQPKLEAIDHPAHYGGADNPYEAIKVIEAWQLGFHLGNTVKYISRAGKKDDRLKDLKKARWYLDREIANLEKGQ